MVYFRTCNLYGVWFEFSKKRKRFKSKRGACKKQSLLTTVFHASGVEILVAFKAFEIVIKSGFAPGKVHESCIRVKNFICVYPLKLYAVGTGFFCRVYKFKGF